MESNQELQVEDRILQVLKKLGIEKTHVAGRLTMDWGGLVTNHPNKVSSLSLICPNAGIEPDILSTLGSRICVLVGDTGPASSSLREVTTKLPEATIDTLENYTGLSWSDVAEERTRETLKFMTEFLGGLDLEHHLDPVSLPEEDGEVAIWMQLVKLSDVSWMLPLQVVLGLTVAVEGFICLVKTTEMSVFKAMPVLLSTGLRGGGISGLVISMVKEFTVKVSLTLPTASVTLILQLLWVPALRVLKMIGLLFELALVVAELQSPS